MEIAITIGIIEIFDVIVKIRLKNWKFQQTHYNIWENSPNSLFLSTSELKNNKKIQKIHKKIFQPAAETKQ